MGDGQRCQSEGPSMKCNIVSWNRNMGIIICRQTSKRDGDLLQLTELVVIRTTDSNPSNIKIHHPNLYRRSLPVVPSSRFTTASRRRYPRERCHRQNSGHHQITSSDNGAPLQKGREHLRLILLQCSKSTTHRYHKMDSVGWEVDLDARYRPLLYRLTR